MNPLKTVFNNTRKPEGIIGKMMAKGMNTAPTPNWPNGVLTI